MSKPTVREAVAPLVVGVAAAAACFFAEQITDGDIWVTAAAAGLAAWIVAFAMTGRWK